MNILKFVCCCFTPCLQSHKVLDYPNFMCFFNFEAFNSYIMLLWCKLFTTFTKLLIVVLHFFFLLITNCQWSWSIPLWFSSSKFCFDLIFSFLSLKSLPLKLTMLLMMMCLCQEQFWLFLCNWFGPIVKNLRICHNKQKYEFLAKKFKMFGLHNYH